MANLFASFNAGVSGLGAAQSSLEVTAHNLANTATVGYTRQQAILTDHTYVRTVGRYDNLMQVGLGVDIVTISQVRDQFLDKQYRYQTGRCSFYEAQRSTVSETEDLFGELEGEEFGESITDLYTAVSELAKTPGEVVARDQLVSTAQAFIERAQVLQDSLQEYQVNLNTEIITQVDRINEIGNEIYDLNRLIRKYEAGGAGANDYRDQRNQLLDELATYVKTTSSEEPDGSISVAIEGVPFVSLDTVFKLDVERIDSTTNMLKVKWEGNAAGDLYDQELNYSMDLDSDIGSLKGLLIARGNATADYTDLPVAPKEEDYATTALYQQAVSKYNKDVETFNAYVSPSVLRTIQAQLDQLVHGVVTTVNDAFCPNKQITLKDNLTITILDEDKAPIGNDENQTMGTELFSRKYTERYTKQTVQLEDGTYKDVMVYNEEDPSDKYTLYSIGQLEIRPELLKSSAGLPLNNNPNTGFTDGYTIDTLNDVLKAWNTDFATLEPGSLSSYDFSEYYNAMITSLGTKGSVFNGIIKSQTQLAQSVDDKRQEVMGVSSDEELTNLIKFQHSYNASSRYITVVDEMIEHLLNRLG